jgi:hypothetical protein
MPVGAWGALLVAALAANVAFIAGWRHRVTGPAFAALLLAALTYRNSWSMIYHTHTLLALHVIALALAPSADALSLDAARGRRSGAPAPAASWEYGWGIRLLCAVTVATYWLAGVAKVLGPLGWSWAYGEALRSQIAIDALRKEVLGSAAAPLAFRLYDQVALFGAVGVGTLIIELGAPLALLGRRLAAGWVLSALAMHWGVFFLMGIYFEYSLLGLALLPFIPLERVAAGLRRWSGLLRRGGGGRSARGEAAAAGSAF